MDDLRPLIGIVDTVGGLVDLESLRVARRLRCRPPGAGDGSQRHHRPRLGGQSAGPGRRGFRHRHEVGVHPGSREDARRQVPSLQRRRDGTRHVQGPLPAGVQPAPSDRRHHHRRARDPRGDGIRLPARRIPRSPTGSCNVPSTMPTPRAISASASSARTSTWELRIHRSAGRYICGEETALLNALEGKRAQPRQKPPFPPASGAWGRPTIVNNVETLCNVPAIVRNGAEWYQDLGIGDDSGTKIYGVSGRVNNPGLWELPIGTTIREIIEEHAGGMRDGYKLRGLLPGGASTDFLVEEHLDLAMDYGTIQAAGSRMGTGTMILMDDSICPVDMCRNLEHFFAQESCGFCTPCREGPALDRGTPYRHRGRTWQGRRSGTPRPQRHVHRRDDQHVLPCMRRAPWNHWPARSGTSGTTSKSTFGPVAARIGDRRGEGLGDFRLPVVRGVGDNVT